MFIHKNIPQMVYFESLGTRPKEELIIAYSINTPKAIEKKYK
tara:strand:- start:383 stop:508 length:126 start_codon:yes stop_codon:yes gene_type:complete